MTHIFPTRRASSLVLAKFVAVHVEVVDRRPLGEAGHGRELHALVGDLAVGLEAGDPDVELLGDEPGGAAEAGADVDDGVGGVEGERLHQAQDVFLIAGPRSEEHTSELQSLMRISYAVFCLKKKTPNSSP